MRGLLFCVLLALFVLHVGDAHADEAADAKRAGELYEEGKQKFRAGDFRGALALFQQANALDAHPVLVYNIARAHESLGELEGAIAAYEKYLAMDPEAQDRGAVEQRLVTLRRDLEERERLEKRARELEKPQPAPAPLPEPPPTPSPVPWIIAGVGVLGVGVGVVLGAVASSRYDDAVGEPNGGRAQELEDDAQSLGTGANVSFAVGGAVALGSVIAGVVDLVITF